MQPKTTSENTPPSIMTEVFQLLQKYWLILLGLLVMYVPTFTYLFETVWGGSEQGHGPLVMMVVLYLFWVKKDQLAPASGQVFAISKAAKIIGWIIFALGAFLYVVGRSQEIIVLDLGSLIFILMGILLINGGLSALKTFWFPLFFLIFMIPLPGSMLDAVTLPMKTAVSYVASHVLYWFDYPVARTGVIIQISQYKLLVADACAGMHTLISLEALGLLYLNIVKHDSLTRNIVLAILIVPISFAANVIRVIVLILVTYYFGDAAGQGFIHGFAGMLLFTVALMLIMSVDSAIQYFISKRETPFKLVGNQ